MKRKIKTALFFTCILVGLTGCGKSMSDTNSNTIEEHTEEVDSTSEIQNESVSEGESDEATNTSTNLLGDYLQKMLWNTWKLQMFL